MRAAVVRSFGGPIAVETVPDPEPPAGGVVLRVRATGVCRSDWHAWQGHDAGVELPIVPGHEMAGVVEAVGEGVSSWRPGDRVTLPFVLACGRCPRCEAGDRQVCDDQHQPGFTHWGSFAELVAVGRAEGNLVRLPESVDFATAAALGCRFATAFRGVLDQGRLQAGEWAAVHGCGGVGLSAVMIAAAAGGRVLAVDIDPEKLALARSLGAEQTLDARGLPPEAVAAAAADLTEGGPHLSLDCLGHPDACLASVLSLRPRGRHVQAGLLLAGQARTPLPMDRVVALELEVLGTHGMAAPRYAAMLGMIAAGRLDPARLVGRRITLDEAPAALTAMGDFAGVGATVIDHF